MQDDFVLDPDADSNRNVPVLFVCLFPIWLRILHHRRAVLHTTRQTPLGAACPRSAPLSRRPLAPRRPC